MSDAASTQTGAVASLSDAEHRLKGLLHATTILFLLLTLALLVLPVIGAELRNPPWIPGAAGATLLVTAVAALAGGDPRRRPGLLAVLLGILVAAALIQGAYLLAGTGSDLPLGSKFTGYDWVMLAVAVVELGVIVALVIAALPARMARLEAPGPRPVRFWTSNSDAGLRPLLVVLGAVAILLALAAAIGPFVDDLRQLFAQPLLSAHIAAGAVGAAGLCFYTAGQIRNRLPLVGGLVLPLAASAIVGVAFILFTNDLDHDIEALGVSASAQNWIWVGSAASAALALILGLLRRLAFRIRLKPGFLGASEYRTLIALSDVIVQGPEESVPPREIAANVDRYIAGIRARRRIFHRAGLVALQLHPLIYAKAPFSELDEESRLHHLQIHFHQAVRLRIVPRVWRHYVQVMLRIANQLTYLGYYNDPRSFPGIGYTPFTQRPRFQVLDQAGKVPDPGVHPLKVSRPADIDETDIEADVCVIGSGAGGAVLAYGLAERGESVVILERGEYVEPRNFNEDEVEMIGKLYADGVFQQTEDFRFTVLQGSCVGGSTVVNNAVSIPLPEAVLARWNEIHGAGIQADDFYASTAHIENWLSMTALDDPVANPDTQLNPSYPKFLDGVEARRHDPEFELTTSTARANINGCIGSGYCNIGCRWGKKLSMLDTVLPWAQAEFGEDKVHIIAEAQVERIVADDGNPRRATEVEAKLYGGRKLRVRARKVVVAAGAVSSPYLLLRSGIAPGLPVGRYASFNMGAPLTAEFDEDLDAFDGVQISHLGFPRPERGWVFETWFNPPVAQALNMPGWFDQHYENMRRYRRLMAVGALVGTDRNGRIGKALTGGPAINYVPTSSDLRKLADGLIELGQILFAGGAKAMMLNGWDFYRFTSPNSLYELPSIMSDPSQLALGTGHPQGGNAIGSDPSTAVVGSDFRVHGFENLFVCDASVFPSSITVNPQLTVMSLAHYATPLIAGAT